MCVCVWQRQEKAFTSLAEDNVAIGGHNVERWNTVSVVRFAHGARWRDGLLEHAVRHKYRSAGCLSMLETDKRVASH